MLCRLGLEVVFGIGEEIRVLVGKASRAGFVLSCADVDTLPLRTRLVSAPILFRLDRKVFVRHRAF